MGIVTADPFTLATAVASPAGTVAFAYPSGYVQADFTGDNANTVAYLYLNDNDRFEEADDEFDISYGASTVTITNKTGFTWPVGTVVQVGLSRVAEVDSFIQAAAVADLGGSLTGTVDGDLEDVADIALSTGDTYADADVNTAVNTAIASVNTQIKELQAKTNAILQALRSAGVIDAS